MDKDKLYKAGKKLSVLKTLNWGGRNRERLSVQAAGTRGPSSSQTRQVQAMKSVRTFWRDSFKQSCSSLPRLLPLLNLITHEWEPGGGREGGEEGKDRSEDPPGTHAEGSGRPQLRWQRRARSRIPVKFQEHQAADTARASGRQKNDLLSPQQTTCRRAIWTERCSSGFKGKPIC